MKGIPPHGDMPASSHDFSREKEEKVNKYGF
jgi:hypothetical protein